MAIFALRMNHFHVIAFTHHSIGVDEIGKFHLEEHVIKARMESLKNSLELDEIMYLSTCNRVEFTFVTKNALNENFVSRFLTTFNGSWDDNQLLDLTEASKHWNGINAVNHLIEVACSLDSMVIGEREIITQMKQAFDFSRKNKLSGDTIRIVMRQVVETAKKVYTLTNIAAKPVSVVSLAYQELKKRNIPKDARILFIGAGVTNTNMGRFLINHGYKNFTVFNRSLENAQLLANLLSGKAQSLENLKVYQQGFDILVCCTSSKTAIINPDLYATLLNGETGEKTIVDLAIPADLDVSVSERFEVDYISIGYLKTISESNLNARKKELIQVRQIIYEAVEEFKQIFKMRQVEIKMRCIPEKVKEIKEKALSEVFEKDLKKLDEDGLEVVNKILNYMEKKYVSVPMLMAKQMIDNKEFNNNEN